MNAPAHAADHGPVLLYRDSGLIVTESVRDGLTLRDLWFGQPPKFRQSSFCVERPQWLVTDYTRQLMAALLLLPQAPRRVLALGTGGAAVPRALKALFGSTLAIDLVDITLAVFKVAHRWFGLDDLSQYRLYHHDARQFVGQAAGGYDLVVLDVWDDQGVPDWLREAAFWQQLGRLTAPAGVLCCNAPAALAEALAECAAPVFASQGLLRRTNATLFASHQASIEPAALRQRCTQWLPALAPMGVPLADYTEELVASLSRAPALAT